MTKVGDMLFSGNEDMKSCPKFLGEQLWAWEKRQQGAVGGQDQGVDLVLSRARLP